VSDSLLSRFGHEFAVGDVLFREGEPGDVMFVVQSGAVRISKQVGGAEKILAVLGPGEFLGEMAILNGKPRTATATAVETVRCLLIDSRTLESMVARNAEIALRLIKKLAKRLDSADTLVSILMHKDPRARFILALSRHADAFGEPVPSGLRIRATLDDIATEVGAAPSDAREIVSLLKRVKLLMEEGGAFVVADVSRLHEFAELLAMPERFSADGSPTSTPAPTPVGGGEGGT
jgi:CRP/FNR family cyclic AMP-dependent transcriptional regulator